MQTFRKHKLFMLILAHTKCPCEVQIQIHFRPTSNGQSKLVYINNRIVAFHIMITFTAINNYLIAYQAVTCNIEYYDYCFDLGLSISHVRREKERATKIFYKNILIF